MQILLKSTGELCNTSCIELRCFCTRRTFAVSYYISAFFFARSGRIVDPWYDVCRFFHTLLHCDYSFAFWTLFPPYKRTFLCHVDFDPCCSLLIFSSHKSYHCIAVTAVSAGTLNIFTMIWMMDKHNQILLQTTSTNRVWIDPFFLQSTTNELALCADFQTALNFF